MINTAKQMGYRVVEDLFIKKDLEEAYECFVTNSIDEIVPISNIGNVQFLGRDGTIYQRLHNAYIDEILRTIKKGE
ncbi:4-amino-4-deoxychorismate lyase OS=Ureibacillus acetophenoni OX=614649 GN=SAMN05877842_1248 PE=4 SV=1 [Ureibacillus acetophenoni]